MYEAGQKESERKLVRYLDTGRGEGRSRTPIREMRHEPSQRLDEVVLNRVAGGRTAGREPQLSEDGSDMGTDRGHTHHQSFGYLRIGQPFGQQAQDLAFSLGQQSLSGHGRLRSRGWGNRRYPWRVEFLSGKNLLRCHTASRGPRRAKGLL